MSRVLWRTMKRQYCDRIAEEVSLEVKLVFPATFLPDQPPKVIGHRCSMGMHCNQIDKPACVWAGTQPDYDPFRA